jgi:RimJ/RimL family protein N-acetyltransferase
MGNDAIGGAMAGRLPPALASLDAGPAPPAVRALFDPAEPAAVRLFAVLAGRFAGLVWSDDREEPQWAIAQETTYGTLYLGGWPPAEVVHRVIARRQPFNDVVFGCWTGDPRLALFPPEPEYSGQGIDFTDRPVGQGLEPYLPIPEGCALQPITAALFDRLSDRELVVASFGDRVPAPDEWFGFFLMRGDEILCEAAAGCPALGLIEVGVNTPQVHRRRGYATVTCAHLIRECEARGLVTYWNCNGANRPSVALAHKLGYRREQPYQLVAWLRRP